MTVILYRSLPVDTGAMSCVFIVYGPNDSLVIDSNNILRLVEPGSAKALFLFDELHGGRYAVI